MQDARIVHGPQPKRSRKYDTDIITQREKFQRKGQNVKLGKIRSRNGWLSPILCSSLFDFGTIKPK
jgi:hypothetical protein